MYVIGKTFRFAAAHHLPEMPPGHKCRNIHGHNFTVTLVLAHEHLTDHTQMVRDYGDLAQVKAWIDHTLDHHSLNEVLPQPTAEVLAKYVFDSWALLYSELHTVVVQETPGTMAAYSPHPQPIVWTA